MTDDDKKREARVKEARIRVIRAAEMMGRAAELANDPEPDWTACEAYATMASDILPMFRGGEPL